MDTIEILPGQSKNVMEILQEQGIYVPAHCNGMGRCGKCKVRFLENPPKPTPIEEKLLSKEEIADNIRLSCTSYISSPARIKIADYCSEDNISINTAVNIDGNTNKIIKGGIALDIGTTTVCGARVDNHGRIRGIKSTVNHQRAFGADVISRINYTNIHRDNKLKNIIEADIEGLISALNIEENTDIVVTGNTAMGHILQGLSCESLGVFPYIPADISHHKYKFKKYNMIMLPGISTFVGSDIVGGIAYCNMDTEDDIALLVDLGTNGEMAIGNRSDILVSSAAAGPVFEGGNIDCGLAGVPGAIDTVDIRGAELAMTTIEKSAPIGICGTGVLELVYELVKNNIVDSTGFMEKERYRIIKNIYFSAKDVREVQLAKSAIRSGIEVLIKEFGCKYEDVSNVYIAGGFGQRINIKKACGIGLIPRELISKVSGVGNTALKGAIMYILDSEVENRLNKIAGNAREINLANHHDFQELYIRHMDFPGV